MDCMIKWKSICKGIVSTELFDTLLTFSCFDAQVSLPDSYGHAMLIVSAILTVLSVATRSNHELYSISIIVFIECNIFVHTTVISIILCY